jgi:hypothetical protein
MTTDEIWLLVNNLPQLNQYRNRRFPQRLPFLKHPSEVATKRAWRMCGKKQA